MPSVTPFKGIRPDPALAERIAALPYDVYNRNEALEEVRREPLSFLAIDRAETMLAAVLIPTMTGYTKKPESFWIPKLRMVIL